MRIRCTPSARRSQSGKFKALDVHDTGYILSVMLLYIGIVLSRHHADTSLDVKGPGFFYDNAEGSIRTMSMIYSYLA